MSVVWLVIALFVLLVLAFLGACWDAKRHPERWYSGPSLDERDGVGTHDRKDL